MAKAQGRRRNSYSGRVYYQTLIALHVLKNLIMLFWRKLLIFWQILNGANCYRGAAYDGKCSSGNQLAVKPIF